MRCPISFSHNELKSTRRKIPRQIFRIPGECANWSPCNTAVASAITTDQTSLASTLIFTHPYGGGIHFTMDRGLGCFKVNVLPRYSIPKPLVKQTNNHEQYG
ncbi:hypothetical protein V6Z11_D05G013100 [Gossypium hirsutum]